MARKPSFLDKLFGNNKSEYAPESIYVEPEVEDFMEVGGSPVPGITLKQVLYSHSLPINSYRPYQTPIAWSPDGKYLATQSDINEFGVRVWNVTNGKFVRLLVEKNTEHARTTEDEFHHFISNIAWSPDGQYLAACYSFTRDSYPHISTASTVYIWRTEIWNKILSRSSTDFFISQIIWSPDMSTIAACTAEKELFLFGTDDGEMRFSPFKDNIIEHAAWSPDGSRIAARLDTKIQIYLLSKVGIEWDFGKDNYPDGLFAWRPDGQILASGGLTQRFRLGPNTLRPYPKNN
jgi:WD40 repeat protein